MFRVFSINRNPVVKKKEKSSQNNFDYVSQNEDFWSSQISKEKTALPSLKNLILLIHLQEYFKAFLNS